MTEYSVIHLPVAYNDMKWYIDLVGIPPTRNAQLKETEHGRYQVRQAQPFGV